MNQFNFEKEMVYGKKHLHKLSYDIDNYNLSEIVTHLFGFDLSESHDYAKQKYNVFTEIGKDTNTEFHKQFYEKLDSGWEEFVTTYEKFIQDVILPYLNLDEALVQMYPSFRVQLPDNVAITKKHFDSDEKHNHPKGEINFVYAITDMFDSNTISVETMPRLEKFERIVLNKGECISFNGNNCSHFNEINKTGKTRMSFDFRVLPLNYYDASYNNVSATKKIRYVEGGYYKRFKRISEKNYYSLDYWFNNTVHDEWDQGKENYYVHEFYEKIIMQLDIPNGKIVVLGTHNCHSFDKLCKHFGYDRCVGYDLHNPTNHPNVIIKDCMTLSDDDTIDIAFCHNDLGNYSTTPKLKEHGQKWASKNIITGGYMLSNNNFNRAKVNNIGIMKTNNFEIYQLSELQVKYDLTNLEYSRIEGYMLSKKRENDIWNKEKHKFNNVMLKYNVSDAWDIVDLFEKKIANYAGSKYAVSVDNCTNALFLCIKYLDYYGSIKIPSRTYCSVPCTIINAGCSVIFEDIEWSGAYQLKPLPLYDGAVRFRRNMYKKDTFHCLSFHIRKHLPIGKGGMILCDDENAYKWFRTARYEGRHIADGISYKEDILEDIGWNMYMTPEQAARGIELFEKIGDDNPDQESSGTCKDLSKFKCYTNLHPEGYSGSPNH